MSEVGQGQHIRVCVRVRPLNAKEESRGHGWQVNHAGTTIKQIEPVQQQQQNSASAVSLGLGASTNNTTTTNNNNSSSTSSSSNSGDRVIW